VPRAVRAAGRTDLSKIGVKRDFTETTFHKR
jgi:hypothetical protein